MPASVWIINLVVLGAVLEADLGRRKITRRRLLRPLIILAIVMLVYVRGLGSGVDSLLLELAFAGAGVALGFAAGSIFRLFRSGDGAAYSRAGLAYAALWIAVVVARLAFVYAAFHSRQLDVWLFTHRISGVALTAALIFMAAGMLLTRTARLYVRAGRLPVVPGEEEDRPRRLAA
jgi:hypothetical protein